jgi:hypothetical protein
MWVARTVAKGRGLHVLGRLEHTAETPSCLRQPTAGVVLAAADGDEPGSAVHPVRVPSRPTPSPPGARRAHTLPRAAHTALRDRTPTPAPRRRRRTRAGADHTANAVALLCATVEQAPLGESTGYRVESRRQALWDLAAGRAVSRRRHLRRISSNTWAVLENPQGTLAHRGLHAGVTATDLLGSGAARHSFPSHTPAPTEPSHTGSPRIPCGWPVAGQPPRGPQGSRPHPRSGDPVRLALLGGGFDLF